MYSDVVGRKTRVGRLVSQCNVAEELFQTQAHANIYTATSSGAGSWRPTHSKLMAENTYKTHLAADIYEYKLYFPLAAKRK